MGSIKKVFDKITGADDADDAAKEYQRMLAEQRKYDPSKILQNTVVANAEAGGAREDLEQSTVQGSSGDTASTVSVVDTSGGSLDKYFKKKTRNNLGSVNF